jgi:hypothetical protein
MRRGIATLILSTVVFSAFVLSSCSAHQAGGHGSATATTVHHPTTTTQAVATTTQAPKKGAIVEDLTWISPSHGWSLVDVPGCGQATCTDVLTTINGGGAWTQVGTIASTSNCLGCGLVGVSHLRFATTLDGYAFGPRLFTTTDGGATWIQQAGPYVTALEPVGSNVMRVSFTHTGCPGPCDLSVQSAAVGGAVWQTLTGPFQGDGVQLVRQGNEAYVALYGNPAGGVDAHATLMLSQDDGTTWGDRADPCGEVGGAEFDATAIAAAPQGVFAVLCVDRQSPSRAFVDVSTDSGVVFAAGSIVTAPNPLGSLAVTSASNLFVGTAGTAGTVPSKWALLTSHDGGQSWQQSIVQSGNVQRSFPEQTFLGFENSEVGRWIGYPYNIWETTDGGTQWVKRSIAF